MSNDYQLHLNFLPVVDELPPCRIYRKPRAASEPRPDRDTASYSFSKGTDRDDRADFWVKAGPADGYEPYVAQSDENNALTRWALSLALKDSVRSKLAEGEFFIPEKGFIDEVALFMTPHPEGHEELVVQPYHLGETHRFGCLADFHFRKKDGVPFSRRIQQLSLMLDAQGRRNLNAYIDRYEKVMAFLKAKASIFSGLRLPGAESTVRLKLEFETLPARQLQSKTYVFGNGRVSRSQFTGLRDHGPLHPLDDSPRILFMFREQDRDAARTLAIALRGIKGKETFSFPGLRALFKSEFVIDGDPVILPDLSEASMKAALEAILRRKAGGESFLPVLVIPEGDDNGYLAHKADFSHAGIPSQVCTLRVIQDEYALKWAIANIALQVFCKAGGQPWKVRPSSEPTLIIGISQSHKLIEVNRTRTVEKFFAFSVMTDNSGVFQSIQVLGESRDHPEYVKQLRDNLKASLAQGTQRFARVVVHTSFKLKRDEIDAIQKTVKEFAQGPDGRDCQFAVVKVNHKCRFFGVNRRVNSLVPYEGTTMRLGHREYLVWFEGIFPDKPTVTKAFPGPTHLEFLHVSDGARVSDADLLQDIVNLSGANWRGFNAKSAPVSVFYCHLVADLVHDFHERGLPLPQVQLIRPWFKLVKRDAEWKRFTDLYHHVKSSIYYSSGLRGTFGDGVPYNIETMVNSLYELERNEEHPLYPFIASWNSRFSLLAGAGFENVRAFRQLILRVLKDWMCPEDASLASYFQGFVRVQNDLNYPLRIFTLNYDTCVDELDRERFRVESGFAGYGTQNIWDFERFEPGDASALQPPQIYLYKIHGSINWKRDTAKNLYRVEQVQRVESDNMEIIFGRDFKLEAADPYLFYAYEFRRYCLLSKLIVSIGYSFGDAHINKMIGQALRADMERSLMVVTRCKKKDFQKRKSDVSKLLGVGKDQIFPQAGSAKEFLEGPNLTQLLVDSVPRPADAPF